MADERLLKQLKAQQKKDRAKDPKPLKKIRARGRRIKNLAARLAPAKRLGSANVKGPSLVLAEADRASDAAGLDRDSFRALVVAILERETGIPQRNVFGCDHGAQSGNPPYCGDQVTKARTDKLVGLLKTSPYDYMNGIGWTQLTWYEKVLRADALPDGVSQPKNQLRVCVEDLAALVVAYGERSGTARYNGAGPAATAYADNVVGSKKPHWAAVLSGR